VLSGHTSLSDREAEIMLVDTGRVLTDLDIDQLKVEVEEKVRPTRIRGGDDGKNVEE